MFEINSITSLTEGILVLLLLLVHLVIVREIEVEETSIETGIRKVEEEEETTTRKSLEVNKFLRETP